jgi:type VI secretion system secreted protein VgrG
LAGGVNLYAYAGNNPVAYTDPFGLSPLDCCFNPVKAAVGSVNVVRGSIGAAEGASLLVRGGAPGVALGTVKLAFGLANVNRGAGQIAEAADDPNGPSVRNVLGLLPFGQEFDDPGEPSLVEYAKDKVEKFVKSPARAIKEAAKEFFAIEE